VDECKYLGSKLKCSNYISNEMRYRILLGNKCNFSLINVLKSKYKSRASKCKLYKTVTRPAVTYGAETWVINKSAEKTLKTFERKVLRKIFGPKCCT
jgi:hypothetical protein